MAHFWSDRAAPDGQLITQGTAFCPYKNRPWIQMCQDAAAAETALVDSGRLRDRVFCTRCFCSCECGHAPPPRLGGPPSAALGQRCSWFLGIWSQARTDTLGPPMLWPRTRAKHTPAVLGLQLAEDRLGGFSASRATWVHSCDTSPLVCVYAEIDPSAFISSICIGL